MDMYDIAKYLHKEVSLHTPMQELHGIILGINRDNFGVNHTLELIGKRGRFDIIPTEEVLLIELNDGEAEPEEHAHLVRARGYVCNTCGTMYHIGDIFKWPDRCYSCLTKFSNEEVANVRLQQKTRRM